MKKYSCVKSVVLSLFGILFFSNIGLLPFSVAGGKDQNHCSEVLECFWRGYSERRENYVSSQCYRNSFKILQNLYLELTKLAIPFNQKEGHVVFITDERNLRLMKSDPSHYLETTRDGNDPRLLVGDELWVWHVIAEFRGLVFDFDQPEYFSSNRRPLKVYDYFQQLVNQSGQVTSKTHLRVRSIPLDMYENAMSGAGLKSGLRELFLENETPLWHTVESYVSMFPQGSR